MALARRDRRRARGRAARHRAERITGARARRAGGRGVRRRDAAGVGGPLGAHRAWYCRGARRVRGAREPCRVRGRQGIPRRIRGDRSDRPRDRARPPVRRSAADRRPRPRFADDGTVGFAVARRLTKRVAGADKRLESGRRERGEVRAGEVRPGDEWYISPLPSPSRTESCHWDGVRGSRPPRHRSRAHPEVAGQLLEG